jgi:hypothetical protein
VGEEETEKLIERNVEPLNYHQQARRSKWIMRYAILVPLLAIINMIIWPFFGEELHRQTQINRHSDAVLILRICGVPLFPLLYTIGPLLPRLFAFAFFPFRLFLIVNGLVWGACIVGIWHAIAIVRGPRKPLG